MYIRTQYVYGICRHAHAETPGVIKASQIIAQKQTIETATLRELKESRTTPILSEDGAEQLKASK